MKKLLRVVFVLLLLAGFAYAEEKTLQFGWEHDGVDIEVFMLFYGLAAGNYTDSLNITYQKNEDGYISGSYKFEAPADAETTYFFAMTAVDSSGNESAYSDEVSIVIDFKGPNKVFNLKVKVIEAE